MTRKRANIRPDLVGEIFTNGEEVYRLISCDTEPKAVIIDLAYPELKVEKPISFFANLIQLKPIRPIEKPKKPRADLGHTHKKKAKEEHELADEKDDNLIIHVAGE